jgi:hypothetical protein
MKTIHAIPQWAIYGKRRYYPERGIVTSGKKQAALEYGHYGGILEV